jgi:hypothetical protein
MEQVGQTPGRVDKGANQLAQLRGQPARVWGGSAQALVVTHLHEEEKPESMEKVGNDRSTRPGGHHLVPNWPLQVGGGPIHPYKYHPYGESWDTTLYM